MLLWALMLGCGRVDLTVVDECDACGGDCVEEKVDIGRRYHEDGPIEYDVWPPAGGVHDPCWAPWGIHDEPVDASLFVHNLEHGGVVLLHDCTDCDEDIAALHGIVADMPAGAALSSPARDLPSPFVVLAWRYRLLLGCADTARIETFIAEHLDQAPERTRAEPTDACM